MMTKQIPCILEAKRQSDCGPDIRCQCTTGWNKIHDSVKECLTATTPCSEANDGASTSFPPFPHLPFRFAVDGGHLCVHTVLTVRVQK